MGKYTIYGADVDKAIDQLLGHIVDRIVEDLPEVESVLLVGGFGRGEGSVRFDGGSVKPVKDFDFSLIFNKKIPYDRVKIARERIRKELNSDYSLSDLYPYRAFTVDFNATTVNRMNLVPDIMVYEAKVASHLIFGGDSRERIHIDKKDVPLRSGARILFQKGISLIGQMSGSYLVKGAIPEDNREMFIYECMKVYVEIGTALSILGNIYEPSYRERSLLLEKTYKDKFRELYEQQPDLGNKIVHYTQFKLAPDFSVIKEPLRLWFEAREALFETLKYYMGNYLEVLESGWPEFCEKVKAELRRKHHISLIRHNLRMRWGLNAGENTLKVLNQLFQFYDNVCYIKSIARSSNYQISVKSLDWFTSPYISFFYSTLLILHSLKRDGSFHEEDLVLARKVLGMKPKRYSLYENNLWEDSRQMYLESLRLLPCMF